MGGCSLSQLSSAVNCIQITMYHWTGLDWTVKEIKRALVGRNVARSLNLFINSINSTRINDSYISNCFSVPLFAYVTIDANRIHGRPWGNKKSCRWPYTTRRYNPYPASLKVESWKITHTWDSACFIQLKDLSALSEPYVPLPLHLSWISLMFSNP